MIPLNAPSLGALERQYVLEALESGWTTTGAFVTRFEREFAAYCGRKYAVACSSGTAALWLAIKALGLRPGERVLSQSYTCESAGTACLDATGQPPLVCDVDPETWGMDADRLAFALLRRPEIKVVVLAHIYGVPARDTEAIVRICADRGVALAEDFSECHGGAIGGRRTGSFGDVSVASLRGEKSLGAGQFGILLSDDEALAKRAHQWGYCGLPADSVRYWSTLPGLNWQPSNLNAALACAQLSRIDELKALRRAVHERYRALLADVPGVRFQGRHGDESWWLTALRLSPEFTPMTPGDIGLALAERGVGSRPAFYALNLMPYIGDEHVVGGCANAEGMIHDTIILPSGPTLTAEQQETAVHELLDVVGRARL